VPDIIMDGFIRVSSVPSISNIAAPTVAELNAGTRLDTLITPDGLMNFKPEQGWVDNSALSGKFNTQLPGRASLSNLGAALQAAVAGRGCRPEHVHHELRDEHRGEAALDAGTAWATGQAVAVFPVICGIVADEDPDTNSLTRYVIPMGASIDPNVRAVVA
jgi:hypothetical protein